MARARPSRRSAAPRRWRYAFAAGFVLAAAGCAAPAAAPAGQTAARRPNLLFILTDEQRANTLPIDGNDRIQAPNLDRLSRQSVVFRRAYVSQPVCSPARATILTGLWPHQTGVTGNNIPLPAEALTLPELLSDVAYRTAFMGKWHLGDELRPQQGFREWASIEDQYTDEGARSDYHHWLIGRGYRPDAKNGTFTRGYTHKLPLDASKAKFLEERAIEFLERNRAEPFILYLSFLQPHTPNTGPLDDLHDPARVPLAPSVGRRPPETEPLRYRLLAAETGAVSPEEWRVEIARYWGLVTQVDRSVGAVLARLSALGLDENTIVVFTSEHGKQLGEHGIEAKQVMYEGSARVPFLLRAPGVPHRVVDSPVSHIDLVPTLLELLGRPRNATLPGRSLLPLARGAETAPRDVFLQWHPNGERGASHSLPEVSKEEFERVQNERTRTVVTPDGWKLALSDVDRAQLFNLNQDPHEMRNQYCRPGSESVVASLRERIARWQRSVADTVTLPGRC